MTTQAPIEVRPMTAEEFFVWAEMPDNRDRRFELIEGEIIEMPSPELIHQVIASFIQGFIFMYLQKNPLGLVVHEVDFKLGNYTVLRPDVAYISEANVPKVQQKEAIAPDLAVEVISPSNSQGEMYRTIKLYFQYGVKTVWVVYPETQQVAVHYPSAKAGIFETVLLEKADVLEGGAVLPEFRVEVKAIFPKFGSEGEP